MIDDLSPSQLRSFLEYLEQERGCSGATRNLRLAAIHSLAKVRRYAQPRTCSWSTEIRAVPFKKTPKSPPEPTLSRHGSRLRLDGFQESF